MRVYYVVFLCYFSIEILCSIFVVIFFNAKKGERKNEDFEYANARWNAYKIERRSEKKGYSLSGYAKFLFSKSFEDEDETTLKRVETKMEAYVKCMMKVGLENREIGRELIKNFQQENDGAMENIIKKSNEALDGFIEFFKEKFNR